MTASQALRMAEGLDKLYLREFRRTPRPLPTGLSWSVLQGSGIPVPASVTMAYDNAGNRTQMTRTASQRYVRIRRPCGWKRRSATSPDSLANAPNNGLFRLEYTYTLGGQMKFWKIPTGRIDYSHDKVSRLQTVTSPTALTVFDP